MKKMKTRCYSELIQLPTFEARYDYLRIGGVVGESSFGFDRWLNQEFYRVARDWHRIRDLVIVRDNGCDLGIDDRSIGNRIIVHHMNPLTVEDLEGRNPMALDPEFLICVSLSTHNAIHFGDKNLLSKPPVTRMPGDTCPWR